MESLKLNDFKNKKVHFVGVGGISMSALAVMLKKFGAVVQGSDIAQNDETKKLEKLGIKIFLGHSESNLAGVNYIVFSSAIHEDNVELQYAKKNNIPLVRRAELLGLVASGYKTVIAIAGSHGKTTTTAMLAEIFETAGLKPTYHIGGTLVRSNSNFKLGSKKIFLTEACEYMDNYLYIKPDIAVVLDIDSDHLDYFKTLDGVKESFKKFSENTKTGGIKIISNDDENSKHLLTGNNFSTFGIKKYASEIGQNVGAGRGSSGGNGCGADGECVAVDARLSSGGDECGADGECGADNKLFEEENGGRSVSGDGCSADEARLSENHTGLADSAVRSLSAKKRSASGRKRSADIYASNIKEYKPCYFSFDVIFSGYRLGNIKLNIFGKHNISNAMAAILVAIACAVDFSDIKLALENFSGVKRRSEFVAEFNGAKIFHDYAHHPKQIESMIAVGRRMTEGNGKFCSIDQKTECGRGRLIVVFEPHTYSRTKFLFDEFAQVFKGADYVIFAPAYSAREDLAQGIEADELAEAVKKNVAQTEFISGYDKIFDRLASIVSKGDIVFIFGAGTIDRLAERFRK